MEPPCPSQRDRCAAGRRIMQRFEGPGLRDSVVAAEEQLAIATSRVTEIFELESVGVDEFEFDPLDPSLTAELYARHLAVPRIIEEERALAADGFQLVALRHGGTAVEEGHHGASEPEHAGEDPVGPRRSEPSLAVYPLPLAAKEARPADGVTTDIHQPATIEVRAQADVVLVMERVAECGADEPQLADRPFVDELLCALGLRVVAEQERLAHQPTRAVGSVQSCFDLPRVARGRHLLHPP